MTHKSSRRGAARALADVGPHAIDPQSAQRLWEVSEELIKA
ncbi:hypothetical protein ABZW18_34515 [Streptomyces sp. NPDC004647]